MLAKRGHFDPEDESQLRSAAPSEDDDDQGMFAVLKGRAPRAAKKMTHLSAPGAAMGSVTSRDDEDHRTDYRSGFEDEWERMDVNQVGRSSGQKSHKTRRSRRLRKSTQRRSPSASSEERMVDQAAASEQGSEGSRHSRPTCWDVKPLIPIPMVQPRRDVTKELKSGGPTAELTCRQPQANEAQERLQRDERDCCSEKAQNWEIQAGTAEEPIFLPHLQEPTLVAQLQPPCLVDQVHRELTQWDKS